MISYINSNESKSCQNHPKHLLVQQKQRTKNKGVTSLTLSWWNLWILVLVLIDSLVSVASRVLQHPAMQGCFSLHPEPLKYIVVVSSKATISRMNFGGILRLSCHFRGMDVKTVEKNQALFKVKEYAWMYSILLPKEDWETCNCKYISTKHII